MKVAIIHYWLVGMRGGEKVIESICRLYPDADIYTHVFDDRLVSDRLKNHVIRTTFINRLFRASKNYKLYLPLMPMALEELDLSDYDLIISSESGPAKGIIAPAHALHITYCHSPMRYLWNMYHEYKSRAGFLKRLFIPILAHYLRIWDSGVASRVDHFVANSLTVADRIESYYRRQATVIYPPVDVGAFKLDSYSKVADYYLMAGELVAYKRPDLAIEAFNASGRRLVVIGGGEMLDQLRRMAAANVQLLGPQSFEVLRDFYAQCRALIFPGEEDFGMVPVECMASGRPVVAFGRGGAMETVVDGVTGVFFNQQSIQSLNSAIARLESLDLSSERIVAQAEKFGASNFERTFKAFVDEKMAAKKAAREEHEIALAQRLGENRDRAGAR